jgi:hypothetical protein
MAIAAIAASHQEKFWAFSHVLLNDDDFQKLLHSGITTCRAALIVLLWQRGSMCPGSGGICWIRRFRSLST